MSISERRFEPVLVKSAVIAVLALLMLWPLSCVERLVSERQALQHQAYEVIAAGFGGAQTLGAPILSVDSQERSAIADPSAETSAGVWTAGAPLHLLPEYLRTLTRFEVGGQSLHVTSAKIAGFAALSAPIDLSSIDRAGALAFRLEFEVAGSESLHFLPLGSNTVVSVRVAWPHPDFDGAFLPISHKLTGQAYSANWRVLELNRAVPQLWRGTAVTNSVLLGTAFGLRLFQPSDIYSQNYRAARYGILFVAITFVCFFAWEHLVRGLRLHPMQYLMVGVALATFYLLLLALSEHLGFGVSYAVAASALVTLITSYITGATSSRKSAASIGMALAASYAALYVILLSEDYALLYGSLLLFGILAALMLATRRLDWSGVGREVPDEAN